MIFRPVLLTILTACCCLFAADDYDTRRAETDLKNPDQVFLLAMWCKEEGFNYKASRHLKEVIKLDPDHQAARDAMGYVYYQKRWVHRSRVPGALAADERGAGGRNAKRGEPEPGPSAEDVEWDLTIPPFASPAHETWLAKMTAQMNSTDNYSGEMDSSWRTLLMPEYVASAVPALATALMDPAFRDLYGPVMFAQECMKSGDPTLIAKARALLPFMVHASERVTDSEELYFFALFCGSVGDKRATPRLIELLDAADDATDGAKAGLSMITLIPEDELTADQAQAWWDRYHSTSDGVIYGELLESKDPMVRLNACQRLYPEQDPRIVPTLIDLLGSDEVPVVHGAIDQLKQITGNDWDLSSSSLSAEERQERIDRLAAWWKEQGNTFVFLEFRGRMTTGGSEQVVQDKREVWIRQLSSLDQGTSRTAFDGLLATGERAIGPLIDALESADGIRRGKAVDLLQRITGENFGFEAVRGSDQDRKAAIAKWREWAATKGVSAAGDTEADASGQD